MPKYQLTVTAYIETNDGFVGAAKHANSVISAFEKQGFTDVRPTLSNFGSILASLLGTGNRDGNGSAEAGGAEAHRDITDRPEARGEGRGLERDGAEAGNADKPKRGRGRPRAADRGDEAGPGPAEGERGRNTSRAGRTEDAHGAELRGTEQGAGQGAREDQGRAGRDGGSGSDRGGDRAPDRRVNDAASDFDDWDRDEGAADADDWSDDAPAPTHDDLNRAMTRLLAAMNQNGKANRTHVFEALRKASGLTNVKDIPEEGIGKVLDLLEAEIVAYEKGTKKI